VISIFSVILVVSGFMILNGYDQILLKFLMEQEEFSHIKEYTELMNGLKESGYATLAIISTFTIIFIVRVYSNMSKDIKTLSAFISHASMTNMLINRQIFKYNEFRNIADNYNKLVKERMSDYRLYTERSQSLGRIEKELKGSLEMAKDIINKIPFPVYTIDGSVDSRVINLNKEFKNIIGFSDDSFIIGKKENDLVDYQNAVHFDGTDYNSSEENSLLLLRVENSVKSDAIIDVNGLKKEYEIHRVAFIDRQDKCISILVVLIPLEEYQ
jgi:PAS domain-containing protein